MWTLSNIVCLAQTKNHRGNVKRVALPFCEESYTHGATNDGDCRPAHFACQELCSHVTSVRPSSEPSVN